MADMVKVITIADYECNEHSSNPEDYNPLEIEPLEEPSEHMGIKSHRRGLVHPSSLAQWLRNMKADYMPRVSKYSVQLFNEAFGRWDVFPLREDGRIDIGPLDYDLILLSEVVNND